MNDTGASVVLGELVAPEVSEEPVVPEVLPDALDPSVDLGLALMDIGSLVHFLPPTTDYDYNDVNEHSYLETLPTTDELINAIMASNEFLTPHMNNTLDDFLILNS